MPIIETQLEMSCLLKEFLVYMQFGRAKPISRQTRETMEKRLGVLSKRWSTLNIQVFELNDVISFKTEMLERGCSIGYVSTFLSLLRSFLRYCREERGLDCLPPEKIKIPSKKRNEVEYLNNKQLEQFINEIDIRSIVGLRMMAFVTALLDTGMRVNELIARDRVDISQENSTPFIIGKGDVKRMVMFRSWSLYWLRRYLERRTDNHPALFVTHNAQQEHTRVNDDDMRRFFRIISKKLGWKSVTPHAFRRTAATHFWKSCGDVRIIQQFLGHSKLAITECYLGTDWELVKERHAKFLNYGEIEKMKMGMV